MTVKEASNHGGEEERPARRLPSVLASLADAA